MQGRCTRLHQTGRVGKTSTLTVSFADGDARRSTSTDSRGSCCYIIRTYAAWRFKLPGGPSSTPRVLVCAPSILTDSGEAARFVARCHSKQQGLPQPEPTASSVPGSHQCLVDELPSRQKRSPQAGTALPFCSRHRLLSEGRTAAAFFGASSLMC